MKNKMTAEEIKQKHYNELNKKDEELWLILSRYKWIVPPYTKLLGQKIQRGSGKYNDITSAMHEFSSQQNSDNLKRIEELEKKISDMYGQQYGDADWVQKGIDSEKIINEQDAEIFRLRQELRKINDSNRNQTVN